MPLARKQTQGAAAFHGFNHTMIEGFRVVVAYAHLLTLRDMPMSARY